MVHIIKPYSTSKNLGQVYNYAMSLIPDGDWACICDYDTMFLTSNCGEILNNYAEMFPDYALLTCWTNRIHPLAKAQLYGGEVCENDSIRYHQQIAEKIQDNLYEVSDITHEISGFLMLISKKTWNQTKFWVSGRCLGVDNQFSNDLLRAGKKIGRMEGLYVWHSYRLNDIKDKTHLHANSLHGNNR